MSTATSNGVYDTNPPVVTKLSKPQPTKPATTQKSWKIPRVPKQGNAATIEAFFKGEIPAVRLLDFLSPELCNHFAQKALAYRFERYKDAPEVGMIGLALVDNPNLHPYLCNAALLREGNLYLRESIQLLERVSGAIALNTGRKCKILEYEGRPFWAGNWRLLTGGAGIHLDNLTEDAPELSDMKIDFQGSFVLHIQVPKLGGETILYDKSPIESDKLDPLYVKSGWKYSEAIIDGVHSVVVPANEGELVLLPTQKYHSVNPCLSEDKERISFSAFFVIKKNDPTVYFYS
jgi:hypothetical protein